MATFTGTYFGSYQEGLVYGNVGLGNKPSAYSHLDGYDAFLLAIGDGELDEQQPIQEVANPQVGNASPQFGLLDFYNRIHVQYSTINLGAVVSSQTFPFTIFNAFFVPRTLNDVAALNDQGITLVQPDTTPYDFAPLEEKSYTLSVSPFGPATVDATYTFEFDIRDYVVRVVGTRIIGWRWEPNWASGMTERLEWLTDMSMVSENAEEQRRQSRLAPRQFWEFEFDVQGQQRRIFENALHNWGARIFALPVWPDIEVLTSDLPISSLSILIDTTTRQFRVGELIMFISEDNSVSETLEIDTLTDTEITFTQPTALAWGPGTRVYPARASELENGPALSRFLRTYSYATAQFRATDQATYSTLAGEPTHRGYPVLVDDPDWKEEPSVAYERKQVMLDLATGRVFNDDQAGVPWEVFAYRWVCLDRTSLKRVRQWLYSRAGQAKGIWIPTFTDDIIVTDTITNVQVNIDFEFAGVAAYADDVVHRRDIRIELMNGSVFYRRVSSPEVVVEDVTERLTIDSALGVHVEPEDIRRISWMALCRLDSDSIEFAWDTPYIADVLTVLRSYNNDV